VNSVARNYSGLLAALGNTEQEIAARIAEVIGEAIARRD
jgi:hypothetical protein